MRMRGGSCDHREVHGRFLALALFVVVTGGASRALAYSSGATAFFRCAGSSCHGSASTSIPGDIAAIGPFVVGSPVVLMASDGDADGANSVNGFVLRASQGTLMPSPDSHLVSAMTPFVTHSTSSAHAAYTVGWTPSAPGAATLELWIGDFVGTTRGRQITGAVPFTRTITVLQRDGGACLADGECASGRCTDGVCCATDCGADPSDCMACSTAAGGTADGTCSPLSAAVAPTVICRAAVNACDAPESCGTDATSCPADRFSSDGTPCDDGMACTISDACAAGSCDGAPRACDDGDACTADVCSEPGGCEGSLIAGCCASDAACDDLDPCTRDACSVGTCAHEDVCVDAASTMTDASFAADASLVADASVGNDAALANDAAVRDAAREDDAAVERDASVERDAATVREAGGGLDAAPDAGARTPGSTGCGCRSTGAPAGPVPWALTLVFSVLACRRRR
jgi:hypothetical protein